MINQQMMMTPSTKSRRAVRDRATVEQKLTAYTRARIDQLTHEASVTQDSDSKQWLYKLAQELEWCRQYCLD